MSYSITHFSQSKYLSSLLSAIGLDDANSTTIPMIFYKLISTLGGVPLSNSNVHRRIVGSLKKLTLTRPNISFIVNKLCQFLFSLIKVH